MAKCPNCDARIAVDVRVCPSCAASFAQGAAWRPLPESETERARLAQESVAVAQPDQPYLCPRDGKELTVDNDLLRALWRCGGCSGVFVGATIVRPRDLEEKSAQHWLDLASDAEPASCPLDRESMVNGSYRGVQLDVCPKCLGTWLDKGEIEKVLGGPYTSAPLSEEQRRDGDTALAALGTAAMVILDILD